MKREFLSRLRCPVCGAPLALNGSTAGEDIVTQGSLLCAACGQRFDVRSGIPRFVPLENYASNFGFQWNRFRRTQLDSYSGKPITKQRFFDQVPLAPEQLAELSVLDVGCGAGRFAEIALSAGAYVTGIDYSSAIDAAAENLVHLDRFVPLQGDIYSLPLAPASFDLVYCLGVLQHTPDAHEAFRALVRHVKPGGLLVVDIYHRTWRDWVHPKRWLRPLSVKIEQRHLFAIVERSAPILLSVSRAVGCVPLIGRALKRLVPIANYEGVYPLTHQQMEEWAVLDTFDWLAPRYDQPQTAPSLKRWFDEAGFEGVEVLLAHHLTGRGRSPMERVAS